jgi:hypothetical protein
MYENLCGNCVGRIDLTVHRRAILIIVKSTCNGIKNSILSIKNGKDNVLIDDNFL